MAFALLLATCHGTGNRKVAVYQYSEGKDEEGHDLDAAWGVEINLSRMNEMHDYIIQNMTLTLVAG